jgi:hypothetical protein
MKLIGDTKTAKFVLAKVQELKSARDHQLTIDPFEGKDLGSAHEETVAYIRRDHERMRKEGHPVDLMLRDESLVIFGFPEVILGAHETRTVHLAPGIPFRGHCLFIIPENLGTANVCDFLVGRTSQLVLNEPIPVEMFSPLSMSTELNLDRAATHQPIAITLNNNGEKPHTLRAAIFGRQAIQEEKPVAKKIDTTKRAELYATLRKQLDTPSNHALLTHLDAITALESDLPDPRRIPLGLKPHPSDAAKAPELAEGETRIFAAQPYVDVRVTHLVLTEETAQHFDMQDFKIGKDSQLPTSESVPMDFFSVTHNQKALAKVSTFRSKPCSEDQTIGVFVQRRNDGQGPKVFQGLLWVEYAP